MYAGPSREQIEKESKGDRGRAAGEVGTSCGAFYWRPTRYGALTEHLRKSCNVKSIYVVLSIYAYALIFAARVVRYIVTELFLAVE